MDDPAKHNDPVDRLFNVFFFCLWGGPVAAALLWSPWWLLLYIPVLVIVVL